MRNFYVRPPREFQLGPGKLQKLLKPLYCLADAGDYWHNIASRHLREYLNMAPSTRGLGLLTQTIREKPNGLIGLYVYDAMAAGNYYE